MPSLRSIRALFEVPADDPELTLSQLAAFSKQVPLLYLVLVANTIGLAATHLDSAPAALAILAPAVLCVVCAIRVATWWRVGERVVSAEQAVRKLRMTVKLVVVLGAAFVAWAFSLYPYGDAYAQGHVAFYMAITAIGSIFCLMHLRAAALLLALVVIVPFICFFLSTGNTVFVAISINLLLVAFAMINILLGYYRDFANLIKSQKELVAEHAETRRLSDENLRLANVDSLTDLPNRRRFFADLSAVMERCRREGSRFAVALIDLDGFKPVNDIHGHATGDRVLIEAGRRLRQVSGPSVCLARLGGDEFGLIIDGAPSDADIRRLGQQFCDVLQAPYVLPDLTAQVSGSIGFATFPDAGRSTEQLLERADYALYHAKQNHRGTVVVFSHEHATDIRETSLIEQGLRHADLEREMSLAFQPIIDIATNRTTGFETLARWTSPTLGTVPPSVFIKVAERSDLIGRLTEVLLKKALEAARGWPKHLRVAFNLSMRDIASPEAILRITTIVRQSGVEPGRIDLEVTETAMMRDFEQTRAALRTLKLLGVHISLDDFGTGYSSLSYVHRLPLDKIKIDRSFVAEIETDKACLNIVKTVIDLCRNLDLDCVVEGVETAAQLRILRDLGCRAMQGYFFSPPMAEASIRDHLAAEPHGPGAAAAPDRGMRLSA
jgi:diguanylate cyclase (GGDEF)-like protein